MGTTTVKEEVRDEVEEVKELHPFLILSSIDSKAQKYAGINSGNRECIYSSSGIRSCSVSRRVSRRSEKMICDNHARICHWAQRHYNGPSKNDSTWKEMTWDE